MFPCCHGGGGSSSHELTLEGIFSRGRRGSGVSPTFLCWQARPLTSLSISVPREAPGGLCPSPREPPVPGSPRGTAWSEDTEVNTDCSGRLRSTARPLGVLKLPGSSHLSRQLHLEKVLITPCSKPCMPWQVIKHPTLLFRRGGSLSDS